MQSIYLATIFAGALVCLLLFAPVLQEAFLKPTTPYATAIPASRNVVLAERLDAYMRDNSTWRDPDLSLTLLASALNTNRTTLSEYFSTAHS